MYYFIMTTISTVGYGSSVRSTLGRVSIIFFMTVVVVVIPDMFSRMVTLINSKSVYARIDYNDYLSSSIEHIVLIGAVS